MRFTSSRKKPDAMLFRSIELLCQHLDQKDKNCTKSNLNIIGHMPGGKELIGGATLPLQLRHIFKSLPQANQQTFTDMGVVGSRSLAMWPFCQVDLQKSKSLAETVQPCDKMNVPDD